MNTWTYSPWNEYGYTIYRDEYSTEKEAKNHVQEATSETLSLAQRQKLGKLKKSELIDQILELKKLVNDNELIIELREELNNVSKELYNLEASYKKGEDLIETLRKEIASLRGQKEAAEKTLKEARDEIAKYKHPAVIQVSRFELLEVD